MPQNVTSITTNGQVRRRHAADKPYNPGFVLNNQLADTNNVFPLPSTAWNIDSDGRTAPDQLANNPEVAKKIYEYLNKAGRLGRDVRHQPALAGSSAGRSS